MFGGLAVQRVERFERLCLLARPDGRGLVGLLQRGEDFLAVHIDRAGRLDAETHLIAANFKNGDDDVVTDHDALVRTSREHEHDVPPPWRPP